MNRTRRKTLEEIYDKLSEMKELRDHIGVDDSFEKDFKEKYDVFFPVTDISSVGLGETICFEGKQAILLGYATTPNGSYAYGNYIK